RDVDNLIGRRAPRGVDVADAEDLDVVGEAEWFDLEWVVEDVRVEGHYLDTIDAVGKVLIVDCEGRLRTADPVVDEALVLAVMKRQVVTLGSGGRRPVHCGPAGRR